MKKMAVLACGLWVCLPAAGAEEKTFKGEIVDSQCALGVHSLTQSHKEMMGMTPSIKTETECVRYCVKERGGRFVLQIKGKVYRLDRQDLAEQNAGGKVKVTGTLDPKTDTIMVRTMEPVGDGSAVSPQSKPKE